MSIKTENSLKAFTLIIIFCLVALTACSSAPKREKMIKINLSGLKMLDSTLFEQRFEAEIRIQNRSQSELKFNGMSYDLSLNDKDFASGVTNQKTTILPLSETIISVPLTSTLFGLIRQINAIEDMKNKPFNYEIFGNVYTDNDRFGISFSEKGQIDLTARKNLKN